MSPDSGRIRSGRLLGAAFCALGIVLGIDFHFDVRARDVFSWMDPYQYFFYALELVEGGARLSDFTIPSIFPFVLVPALAVEPSIPAALWTNFALTPLLFACIHALCRELEIETPSPVAAILVVSSPLLLGLSRTLYIEFALTVAVAFTFLCWLRFTRTNDWRWGTAFSIAFGFGFMLKMTFPIFFALPIAAAVAERFVSRRLDGALPILFAIALPVALVLLIQTTVFPTSILYYTSLGNTALPVMKLIGPPEWSSWSSVAFYFGEIGRTMLYLLTPFLGLAVLLSLPGLSQMRWKDLAGPRATLWCWLLGPLVLLIAQPVKEPRHVAPCVIPAVLLIVMGIEGISGRVQRRALLGTAVAIAAIQFAVITGGWRETPYFMDQSLRWDEIRAAMTVADVAPRYRRTPEAERSMHWMYDQNIVIADFPANEALALTWQLFPGVTLDLSTLQRSTSVPYQRFEDLFIFAAFNTYNRRTGWPHYYETLPRQAAIRNADYVILNQAEPGDFEDRFPDHVRVGSIQRAGSRIFVLRSKQPRTMPYRALYAQEFLERNPALSPDERHLVMFELFTAAALGGYDRQAESILKNHPELRNANSELRTIHWIGGYDGIDRLARARISALSSR